MELETLEYEERGHVAVVRLNRPEQHNSFNTVMQRELRDTWQAIKVNDDVRAVVLTAAGTKAFCTGIDRSDIPVTEEQFFFDPYTYDDPGKFIGPRSQELWKPVIAAVNGMACGGAFYLLGESDILIAGGRIVLRPARDLRHARRVRTDPDDAAHAVRRSAAHDTHRQRRADQRRDRSAVGPRERGRARRRAVRHGVRFAESIAPNPPQAVQASLRTVSRPRPQPPAAAVARQPVPDQGHDRRGARRGAGDLHVVERGRPRTR